MRGESALFPVPGDMTLLANGQVRLWWTGVLCTSVAVWQVALAQAWLTTTLTDSPSALALVTASSLLPQLLLVVVGGSLGDRMERRGLLVRLAVAQTVTAGVLAALVTTGSVGLWQLVALSFALGSWLALMQPISLSFARDLVPAERLPHAIALSLTATYAGRAGGPLLAGGLIAFVGITNTYIVAAMLFAISVAAFAAVRVQGVASPGYGLVPEVREALRTLRTDRVLLPLWTLGLALSLVLLPSLALIPLAAVRSFHLGPEGVGGMVAAVSIGQLSGSVAALALAARTTSGRGQIAGYALQAGALWVFASSDSVALATAALVAFGGLHGLLSVQMNTVVQRASAAAVAARMQGLFLLVFGTVPLGQLALGALADRYEIRTAMQAAALVFLTCVVVVAALAPELRAFRLGRGAPG